MNIQCDRGSPGDLNPLQEIKHLKIGKSKTKINNENDIKPL